MSKPPAKVVVTKQRTVHTYSELWHASDCLLDAGVENPEGSSWQFLSSLMLTAFTFEAYLNHVGAVTFKCWADIDQLPPRSKLQLLCEALGVEFSEGYGARPLQTISNLLNFRNTLAHGRSIELQSKPLLRTTENYHVAYREELLTDWEGLIRDKDFAVRAREDVRAVLERIHDARQGDKEHLFTFGLGLHGASIVHEP
jgi:hypothetical protein